MVTVEVTKREEGWVCEVVVDHEGERTPYTVTVSRSDLERWGHGDVEDLVKRSFDFLLKREPPSSILKSFDLSVIQKYFPEYDREIWRS